MSQQPSQEPSPPSGSRRLFRFALAELKGLALAFWRPFWKVTLAVALLLLVLLAVLVFRADPPPPDKAGSDPPLAAKLLAMVVFSLVYAVPFGLAAGTVGAVWRLCGWGILVPLVAIPLAVTLSLWLCSGWLAREAGDTVDALQQSAEAKGLPETKEAAGRFGKIIHSGGLAALAVLAVLLLPFLAVDSLAIMLDPGFLWQFTRLLFAFVVAVCLGLIPSGLFSLVVLSFQVVRRMRGRYRSFAAASEETPALEILDYGSVVLEPPPSGSRERLG